MTPHTATLSYTDYLDKVFGCWLGKCISGTIGAPYEGMKELMDLRYDPVMLKDLIPNDDLDLQVLWLEVLEQKGVNFSSRDLAEAFATKCPYAPGEYAVFKKNFRRGIDPPLCGKFNNRFFLEGMGSPIRSEIWACIAPGAPDLAAELSEKDGVLDHAGNSVYAEKFFAAMESAAFLETDLENLITTGLRQVPEDARLRQLILDVGCWWKEEGEWQRVRSRIVREYGHPSCTNLFQNIGFTLLALYAGKGNLIDTTMIALNCGFDTDCSCATAGALLGILQGAESLIQKHGLSDIGYLLEVDIQRRSDCIKDLAEDTCTMGLYFTQKLNPGLDITGGPAVLEINGDRPPEVVFDTRYQSDLPAVGPGDSRDVYFDIRNQGSSVLEGQVQVENLPQNWHVQPGQTSIRLDPDEEVELKLTVSLPDNLKFLAEKNLPRLVIENGQHRTEHEFGLVGASVWQAYGPFWENRNTIPPLAYGESYIDHLKGKTESERIDTIHTYQNNNQVEFDKEYLQVDTMHPADPAAAAGEVAYEPKIVCLYEDRFNFSDIFGFEGPCILYVVRTLISPEDRKVCLQVGHTDAFKLWLNGKKVAEKRDVDWSTSGNVNLIDCPLVKGENRIVLKLARHGAHADFSLILRRTNPWCDHYDDFVSKVPSAFCQNPKS